MSTDERPPRDIVLMGFAALTSTRGTCSRLEVGAIAAKDGRVLSSGYNGAPTGLAHCVHDEEGVPCRRAIHAEANAVAFAAKHGVSLEGATVYITHSPCFSCAQLMINSGIVRIVYSHLYRDTSPLELLAEAGITVEQIENLV